MMTTEGTTIEKGTGTETLTGKEIGTSRDTTQETILEKGKIVEEKLEILLIPVVKETEAESATKTVMRKSRLAG
jgi:hypothetical protein